MEIELNHINGGIVLMFKIDLIVWKLAGMGVSSSTDAWFKIDLIVWKLFMYLFVTGHFG